MGLLADLLAERISRRAFWCSAEQNGGGAGLGAGVDDV